MIQFNLLPDVKVEYMRTERVKRTVMFAAAGVSLVAFLVFFGLLILVKVIQPSHMSSLTEDIKKSGANLKDTKDLDKILTIQNQLGALPEINAKKPEVTRLFTYISQFTPEDIKISSIEVDNSEKKITMTGKAFSAAAANKFADTLKSTQYVVITEDVDISQADKQQAFSSVRMAIPISNGQITYSATLNFSEDLFDNTKEIRLIIPNIATTASQQGLPTGIFEPVRKEE